MPSSARVLVWLVLVLSLALARPTHASWEVRQTVPAPGSSRVLYLLARQGSSPYGEAVLRTDDAGRTWRRIDGALPPGGARCALAVRLGRPGDLALASSDTVYRSSDGGRTWRVLCKLGIYLVARRGPVSSYLLEFTGDSAGGLFCAGSGGAVRISGDGRSCAACRLPVRHGGVVALVPGRPGTVLVGGGTGWPKGKAQIWRSEDWGRTWKLVSDSIGGIVVQALCAGSADGRVLYAGVIGSIEWHGHLAKSVDGGKNWRKSGSLFDPWWIGADPHNSAVVWAVGGTDSDPAYWVYRSADSGTTFKRLDEEALFRPWRPVLEYARLVLAPPPLKGGYLSLPRSGRTPAVTLRSVDSGRTWVRSDPVLPETLEGAGPR